MKLWNSDFGHCYGSNAVHLQKTKRNPKNREIIRVRIHPEEFRNTYPDLSPLDWLLTLYKLTLFDHFGRLFTIE